MIRCKLINHATCGLEERERSASRIGADEATPHVLLKTCNRTELYWGDGTVSDDMVRHVFRVAAGLESALVGERAIQGQIKQAYAEALSKYKLSSTLNRLFQSAMYTGKRVRSETRIAEGAVSHSQVTVEILKQRNVNLKDKIIGIIGVNKLIEDALKYLISRGAVHIFLSNRNVEKAQALAAKYKGTAVGLDRKAMIIGISDILICATSAPHTIIHPEDFAQKAEDILIFDLAFPRDVDPAVGQLNHVTLLNLEDIELFAQKNISLRKEEIVKAEAIIEAEITKFFRWLQFALH
ncbi:MAG: glutamyl-tRNA reductase [Dysgonamonadaceae bacterium]|nr:glutamyl-tRNA reductase [Dysgonamonadaceae bacterium]